MEAIFDLDLTLVPSLRLKNVLNLCLRMQARMHDCDCIDTLKCRHISRSKKIKRKGNNSKRNKYFSLIRSHNA